MLVEHLSRGNSGWVPRASVVLLTATQVAPDEHGEGGGPHAAYDLGQAAAHITLQAGSMGLHAHQFAGFDRAAVAARLGVPDHYAVLSGIAVGRRGAPDEVDERVRGKEERVRRRKPLAEFVYADAWGVSVAARVSRASRPTALDILLAVLVAFINLPILHST